MNLPSRLFAVAITGFVTLCPALASDQLGKWVGDSFELRGADVIWPDSDGPNDLKGAAAGFTVGAKPSKGEAKQSVDFAGTQMQPLRSAQKITWLPQSLQLKIILKVSPDLTVDGTVIRFGTQWEIRYDGKNSRYVFIVWQDKGTFTTTFVLASPGEWQELEAVLEGGKIRLMVDGASSEQTLKGEPYQDEGGAYLALGGTPTSPSETSGGRPFKGSISFVSVSQ